MKYSKLLCLLLAMSLTTPRTFAQQAVNVQDSLALVDLYDSTNGPEWSNNEGWKQGPVSTWYGVTVTNGRVRDLDLAVNNLSGSVPASFGNLVKLQTLSFYYNQLSSIPASLGNLVNLKTLNLNANQLSSLPASIENLKKLQLLLLGGNPISSLPASFGNLAKLSYLSLGSNQLSSLPASFGNLMNLQKLYLNGSPLSSLPASFGNLVKLNYLDLSSNQLNSLPASFGNLVNLLQLYLNNNQLSSLPASFGNLAKLTSLYLSNNHLSSLPASFDNLAELHTLYLNNNQFSSLPASFGNLKKLQELFIGSNQLSSLPASFDNLARLHTLYLNDNQFSSLPASFGNLKKLYYLELGGNQINSLPASLGNLAKLNYLHLSGNQLSSLPASLNKLNLLELWLSYNKYTFGGLELAIQTFPFTHYAPQDTFKLIKKGNTLIAAVGGTPKNNTFYWYRDGQLDTTIKADSTYTPTKAGSYHVEAHNAIASQLILYSEAVDYVLDCKDCTTTWYRDADGDGFGNPNSSKVAKEQPRGYVSNNLDCNDKNKVKGGPEVCDGIDNDCDGIIDNGLAEHTFYSDFDGDGYGSDKRTITTCAPPPRFIAKGGDLNDDNATVYPGAPELCDGRDNDQNGKIDDGLTLKPFYWDHDKDGYGFRRPVYACAAPPGYINVGGDFNDNDASIHPGAIEHCDGIDEDCDGVIDNGFPQKRFYKDRDGDGWGSNSNEMAGCAPKGYVEKSGDCDDYNVSVHPGTAEIPGNGLDDNCNGQVDETTTTTVTLYSTARGSQSAQGQGQYGNIFSVSPSNSTYVNWWDFGIDKEDGSYPWGGLTKGSDNKLYGTTYFGNNSAGVLFSFDPNTAIYKTLFGFEGGVNGGKPQGTLLQASDGKLYGKAEGGTNNEGILYSFDPADDKYTVLFNFDGVTSGAVSDLFSNGSGPGELMQAANGKLYGTTLNGGADELGTLFSFDPTTAKFTELLDFDMATGRYAGLVQAINGKLYGVASKGGKKNAGFIFTLDTISGKIQEVAEFERMVGSAPNQLIQGLDGKLYGVTGGGSGNDGSIFSFDPSAIKLTRLWNFPHDPFGEVYYLENLMQASDGKLYGTITYSIYSFDLITDTLTKLFDPPTGVVERGLPYWPLVEYEPSCKQITYFQDKDSDTYGNSNATISIAGCTPPKGYVTVEKDCNDADATIYPFASDENCDGKDNNCNGLVDEDGYCEEVVTKAEKAVTKQNATTLHLSAAPNPSQHYFNLHVESSSSRPVQLRVVDEVGRVIEVRQNITPNTTLTVGYNYRPGVYYAEVLQNNIKAYVKLLKSSQ